MPDNYNVENPQFQYQPGPIINQGQAFQTSLDSMFNNVIRQKVANSQIQAQQQQIAQAKQDQAIQAAQASLQNVGFGGPNMLQYGQNVIQGQQGGQSGQSGPFDPSNANGVTHEQMGNYASQMQAMNQLGIARTTAETGKLSALAQIAQQNADLQKRVYGQQGPGQPSSQSGGFQVPTVSDAPQGQPGNTYVPNFNSENGNMNLEKAEPIPSVSLGGNNVPLKPGEKFEAPPPESVTSTNELLRTKVVSDKLFNLYNKLAAKGEVGKVVGTWNEKLGQFTGGSKNSDALEFQRTAKGLTSLLKVTQNRATPEILNNLHDMFSDPKLSPGTVSGTKSAIDDVINQSLDIQRKSYPTEDARISRILSSQTAQKQPQTTKWSGTDTHTYSDGTQAKWDGSKWTKVQ